MNRLEGKVALVTGATAGIGETVARLFAQEGAAVVITGRRKDQLERVAREIERAGGRAMPVPGSVTDEAHARSAVSQAVRSFGKLHILVNNAGLGEFSGLIHETEDAVWEKLLAVNLTGSFRVTRAAIPEMLKAGGGSIVNVSSIASLVGIPYCGAYSVTKGGLDALTRCLAVEYAKQGIRCNSICPGLVDTPMAAPLLADPVKTAQALAAYPMGRPGTCEEVAKLALFLASDESAWMT
ncbi:MAG: SDR family NAD(P)-dependent oxidoreductase, partial [Nitrospiraceae bacterium]